MVMQISFNEKQVYQIQSNQKIKCNFYSKGELTISLNGEFGSYIYSEMTQINLQQGKSYYIKIKSANFAGSKLSFLQMSEEEGKNEFADRRYKSLPDYNEDNNQSIIVHRLVENRVINSSNENNESITEISRNSDVDIEIPTVNKIYENRFALIVGNEDYSTYQNGLGSEVNVIYAANDARAFKEYCIKTLGVPEENVVMLINARAIEFNREISKLNLYAKNSKGRAELIFYYAGHGLPDETTKESYLIPVDVTGSDLKFGVKLSDLYANLTEYPAERIIVFIDACFSGGARNQGLMAARGVKIKPKENLLSGNIVVFSASSSDQSSLPYKEKGHGIFTYYLLKKLQDTKGQLTFKELSDYISEKVSISSLRVNSKEQNPQINVSVEAQKSWEQWRFNK